MTWEEIEQKQSQLLDLLCEYPPKSPKRRDGAVGEGCLLSKETIRLRHQRNQRPREPHSSFTSSYRIKDYNAGTTW